MSLSVLHGSRIKRLGRGRFCLLPTPLDAPIFVLLLRPQRQEIVVKVLLNLRQLFSVRLRQHQPHENSRPHGNTGEEPLDGVGSYAE